MSTRIPGRPALGIGSLVVGVLTLTSLTGCGQNLSLDFADEVQAHAELGAIIRAAQEANNAGDVDGWVALFDDEFRYLPTGMAAVTDRDSLWMLAESAFSEWQTEIVILPVETAVHGDLAVVDSEVHGRAIRSDQSDTLAIDLKQLVVYRRTDRGWRIWRLMTNTTG